MVLLFMAQTYWRQMPVAVVRKCRICGTETSQYCTFNLHNDRKHRDKSRHDTLDLGYCETSNQDSQHYLRLSRHRIHPHCHYT
ncbi:hypothetical protein CONPUDRAFT_138724 [Coniophora puteana RWD-64-598 SS2]|uniref:Uncharacterized protein n=1 Tax=Coniophora puteana (strain RWD-64-598) TaxID=741705 RepID=A0A5M3MGT4_CONPW|nr:uncharacterized protein CONPUDRAFT_138724 [Coniophora puteana RWD-64-598 SS2]EIW78448.1 hypothetical protein CONPUDRAFT_138724 [Coniophora puteana RWD-64-598 SS2]